MTSSINPNNIDGNYPVAGVPNNTQGFRDNFTNIQTNFQYASDEITELQNKAILKAPITGSTLDNNMGDNLIYAVQLSDVSYKEVQITATSGVVTVDYSAANYQAVASMTGSITLGFSNWPEAGTVGSLNFAIVVSNTAYTLTLPATVRVGIPTIDGISPGSVGVSNTITFPSTGTYVYVFETADGGTTISVSNPIRPTNSYSSIVNISNTTPSTNTSTGALKVAGGVGVTGNINAGNVTAVGNITGNYINGNGYYLTGIYADYVYSGLSRMGFGVANGNANISIGSTSNVVVVSTSGMSVSNVTVSGSSGISLTDNGTMGYNAGAGGTVSQTGNKSTGVTLNKPSGEITMQATALTAATTVSFTLTNSTIGAHDVLILNIVGGVVTTAAYNLDANCTSGSAVVSVRNITAGSLSEAIVLRYVVIKGSTT